MLLSRFFTAVGFLTVFPNINLGGKKAENLAGEELGRSTAYFPLAGLFIGLMLWFALKLSDLIEISTFVKSSMLILTLSVITGGLHLDGLADTFDALASGWNRQRALEIMKDGSIGPFGVTAIVFTLILKITLAASLITKPEAGWVLIFPVLGRWSMVLPLTTGRPAKQTGLGKIFTENSTIKELTIATILALAISYYLLEGKAFLYMFVILISTLLLSSLFKHKFGGITGDTTGAICEINETLTLLIAALTIS